MNSNIEKAIVKYITKSANVSDLDILSKWIQKPGNELLFKEYVKTHYAITFSTNNPDSEMALARLIKHIKKDNSTIYKLRNQSIFKYAAAAVIAGIITTTFIFRDNLFYSNSPTEPSVVNSNKIVPGTDKATLTLEDGTQVALEKGNSIKTKNANSNGEEIIYNAEEPNKKEIAYNYLTIPRGGQFYVKLSDGTQVWLNSESQLKYPVSFVEGETRKVELVYGEAYFDVSPSSMHHGSKFKVINKSQEIQVIGTEFNVKAYTDDNNIYTTLVKGVVEVKTSSGEKVLKPSEQSNLNLSNNSLKVSKVDVNTETSWRRGVFSFKGKSLKEIMKVLSRWYDINVIFENKDLENLKFKGSLEKSQSIEDILSIMKSSTINNYKIIDKTLILN